MAQCGSSQMPRVDDATADIVIETYAYKDSLEHDIAQCDLVIGHAGECAINANGRTW